jgi:hypothetical protein
VEMDTTEEDADEVSEVKCYRERWA